MVHDETGRINSQFVRQRSQAPRHGQILLRHHEFVKEIRSDLSVKYSVQLSNELGTVKSSAVLSVQCELTAIFFFTKSGFLIRILLPGRSAQTGRNAERYAHRRRQERDPQSANAAACPSRRPNGSRTESKFRPTPASKSRRRPALIR